MNDRKIDTEPIYEVGSHLYCRKRDAFLTVTNIEEKDNTYYYIDGIGREFPQYDLVDAVDFLSTQIEDGIRINVGFEREDNPKLVSIDRDKASLTLEMNTDKLLEYFDGVNKKTVIENFKFPENCWDCPMVGLKLDDSFDIVGINCVLAQKELPHAEHYVSVRREDCPLREISMKSFE